uniref:4F5 domain-containing protein n=1 Tax=Schistosoma mansoni TaxID=6183 RepID=A0A5K4F805_SCHMA
MTRGNQRDLAREKNLKKQSEQRKSKASSQKDGNKGLTLEERRLRDAEALRAKQQAKSQASVPKA